MEQQEGTAREEGRTVGRAAVSLMPKIAGLACLWAWMLISLFSGVAHYDSGLHPVSFVTTRDLWYVGLIAAFALCLLPWRRMLRALHVPIDPQAEAPELRIAVMKISNAAAALVLTICTLLLLGAEQGAVIFPWCAIAPFVAGLAAGFLFTGWGAVFTSGITRSIAIHYAVALAAGAVMYLVVLYLPTPARMLATLVLPAASYVCTLLCPSVMPVVRSRRKVPRHCLGALARSLVAVTLLGFGDSFMRTVFQTVEMSDNPVHLRWILLGAALLGALITCVTARARLSRDSIGRVGHVLMLAIAVLFLVVPIVHGIGFAADAAAAPCFFLVTLLIWTTLSQIVAAYQLNVRLTFCCGLGAAYLGCLAGSLIGMACAPAVHASYRLQFAVALGCALLVLLSSLFLVDARTFIELLALDRSEEGGGQRRFALRCERAAQMYGLSSKEAEVMVLAAKGRSVQRIQEALGIAASTVNTHISHIYRKMDVHCRQEMLDLIDHGGE